MDLIRENPTIVVGIVRAVLVLLLAYGVNISEDQQQAILGLVAILVVAIGGSVVTRHLVVPVTKLEQAGINPDTLQTEPVPETKEG